MANYSNLKAAINAVIKQNGQGEITGEVMNQVLMAMVNALGDGYQFMGVATPSTNPGTPDKDVFYLAAQAGTYSNFGSLVVTRGFNIIKLDGSTWSVENLFQIDTTPDKTSENPLENKAVVLHGSAFDISELNKVNNTPATYASLSAAIAAIPANIQRGGMIIKYIDQTSGKYVQYRYMNATTTGFLTESNWQGVDNEPTAGSDNLVKSGGVQNELALGAVYDVSAKNPTAGTNNDGKWESLSALLSDANLSTLIPTSVRKGGMSIKFVQSSDNKYVQFRYMGISTATADFTNVTNWQGVDDEPTDGSDNLVKSGGVKSSTIEEKELNIDENGVSGYITDKNKVIIAVLKKDGSIDWLVKNVRDKEIDIKIKDIDELLEYVSTDISNSDGIIKYLVDNKGNVIATINNAADVRFYGGVSFAGESISSRNIQADVVKIFTDSKNNVLGYIKSDGTLYIESFSVNHLDIPPYFITLFGAMAGAQLKRKYVSDNIYNLLYSTKGGYLQKGSNVKTEPTIAFIDDDGIDTILQPNGSEFPGGFASTLWATFQALNKKYSNAISGDLVVGVAAEGQRVGLTPLYGMEDSFDGTLNNTGNYLKKLQEKCGWDVMCHSMTARYIANSYLVNGLDSEFANSLLIDATYSGTNGLGWETTTCYDTVTKKNYKVKPIPSGSTTSPGWDECPLHYAKPYLATSKEQNSTLVINPSYSVKYQVDTWFERAKESGLYKDEYRVSVGWGDSPSIWHMKELFKYSDDCFSSYAPYNIVPLDSNAGRQTTAPNTKNVYSKDSYSHLIGIINEIKENGGLCVLYSHAYEDEFYNGYIDGYNYGTESAYCGPLGYYDNDYPEEWRTPLTTEELTTIDANNYWEFPPERLGIQSWADWYPCPGTTLAMIYDILEYAISQNIMFKSPINAIKEFGNLLNLGVYNPHNIRGSWAADQRLEQNTEAENDAYCIIGKDGSMRYFSK